MIVNQSVDAKGAENGKKGREENLRCGKKQKLVVCDGWQQYARPGMAESSGFFSVSYVYSMAKGWLSFAYHCVPLRPLR